MLAQSTCSRWVGSAVEVHVELVELIEHVGGAVDGVGVAVMVVGGLVATGLAGRRLLRGGEDVYSTYRQHVGRAILLGLEFLVAADIIRTGRHQAHVREHRGAGADRARPDLPQFLAGAGDHRPVALAEGGRGQCRPAGPTGPGVNRPPMRTAGIGLSAPMSTVEP